MDKDLINSTDVSHASIIFVQSRNGQTVLVYESTKPSPVYWKLAGGKGEPGATPLETAVRELDEETGIVAKKDDFLLIHSEDAKNHTRFYFSVVVSSLNGMKKTGVEGEIVQSFMISALRDMDGLFPPHRKVLMINDLI